MGVRVSGDTLLATVWHFLNKNGTQSESWLIALDRTTGSELWTLVLPVAGTGVDIQAAPAVWGRLAIVNTGNGQLFAVDRFTRAVVWQTPVADARGQALLFTSASPAVAGDVVFHDAGIRELYARNAADGRLLWKTATTAEFVGDLTVTPRRVYGSTYGYMQVFDRAGGKQIAEFQQPRSSDPFIASAPAFAGRQLFVGVNGAAWSFDEP
jgi:outer membrane protein assembly factor BamB